MTQNTELSPARIMIVEDDAIIARRITSMRRRHAENYELKKNQTASGEIRGDGT